MNRFTVPAAAPLVAAILAAALLAGVAAPAQASVKSGLDFEVIAGEAPAEAGRTFTGTILITTEPGLPLTELALEGSGWRNLTWAPVAGKSAGKDQPLAVEFTGVPTRPEAPLTISLRAGEIGLRRTVIFGGQELDRRRQALAVREPDFTPPPAWVDRKALNVSPEPAPPTRDPDFDPEADMYADDGYGEAGEKADKASRNIRIRGRFIYVRGDGTVLGADGMTVLVYDDDPFVDDLLGSGITDTDGNFDFTVYWEDQPFESDPDLLLKLLTENSEVQVRDVGSIYAYRFEYGPYDDYSGSDLNIGVGIPAHEEDQAIPHLISNYTRFWRYLQINGYDTRFLEVRWPGDNDEGAYYNSTSETIQLASNDRWESGTMAHEYGHHIHHCIGSLLIINYCNNICDDNYPFDCSHCLWCEEQHDIAVNEGWANYFGHYIPRTFIDRYGFECLNPYTIGVLDVCGEDGLYGDPDITEGFLSACLTDLVDDSWDDDAFSPGFDDRAFISHQSLLRVIDTTTNHNPMDVLENILADNPADKEDIWWTGMNNGFDLDSADPDPVYPIVCTSHTSGVPSANPNLTFAWQRPDDDASGVQGYGYVLSGFGYPTDPGPYLDSTGTTVTYSDLAPGTYYFSIRTVDWAGNWDDTYTSAGPFIIIEPQPLNLKFEQLAGWGWYVVPRNTADATLTSCPLPATLTSSSSTYWNAAARNEGDLPTVENAYTALEVDGVERDRYNWGNLPGWSPFVVLNDGPRTVTGGMHTFAARLDPDDLIDETDENDNLTGKQFSWRPALIAAGTVYYNGGGVPRATAGWDAVTSPSKYYNSYGVNINSSGWWNAVVMWSDNSAADYDLRLHAVNTSPTGGFKLATEISDEPAGWLDAVVINRNTVGSQPFDVGVVNLHGGTSSHKYEHVTSAFVALGDSLVEVMGADDYLMLREFEVDFFDTGGISLDLWTDPPQANVALSWRDQDFTTGDIMEADAVALTDASGHAHLDVVAADPGYTCLAIWRRPMDGDDDLQVTYRIRPALPDLTPGSLAGWWSPIVPRPDATATPTSVVLPSVLNGGSNNTYFNFQVGNISTGTAWGAMRFYVRLDDGWGFSHLYLHDIEGLETGKVVNKGPYTINGGRHTVVLDIDMYNYMVELDDGNNTYGEQYIWSSPATLDGTTTHHYPPPDRIGGWTVVDTGEPLFFNCDGMRTDAYPQYWRAIAVMPGAASDVDLRLHSRATGPKSGFGSNLCWSGWGVGQSDYVLINYNLAAPIDYDAGVLNIIGDQDYDSHAVHQTWLGDGEVHHAATIYEQEILHLYELRLTPGVWEIELEEQGGDVDWGLSFHVADKAYQSKLDVFGTFASAWQQPVGQSEHILIEITKQEYHALTVWKAKSADMGQKGKYILHVMPSQISDVPGDGTVPAATRLARVYPNPFNPMTNVQFDLKSPGKVEVAVFDLAGRKVAVLADREYPAGSHRLVWSARDDEGRRLASGIYMVRFRADGVDQIRKVTLLK